MKGFARLFHVRWGRILACGFMLMWAYVEIGALAFEYSIRDFFEAQNDDVLFIVLGLRCT